MAKTPPAKPRRGGPIERYLIMSEETVPRETVPVEVWQMWAQYVPVLEDTQAINDAISRRLASSETMEELLGEQQETDDMADLLGKRLRIFGAYCLPSTKGKAGSLYMIIDAMDLATNDRYVITCGAQQVCTQIATAAKLGKIPFDCRPYGNVTGSDRTVYYLGVDEGPDAF